MSLQAIKGIGHDISITQRRQARQVFISRNAAKESKGLPIFEFVTRSSCAVRIGCHARTGQQRNCIPAFLKSLVGHGAFDQAARTIHNVTKNNISGSQRRKLVTDNQYGINISLAVLAFSALINFCSFAQAPLTPHFFVPDKAIKVSPLHLLNFYPTIELSYEQKILPRVTTGIETGYVLNYQFNAEKSFQNKRGIKLKWETRYYFGSKYYTALEPYMNVINFDRHISNVACFDLECNYEYTREYDYKMKYREQGVSLKVGFIRYLNAGLFLDLNSGITLRRVRYHAPEDVEEFFDDTWTLFDIPNEEDRIVLSPNVGLRLGYRLK